MYLITGANWDSIVACAVVARTSCIEVRKRGGKKPKGMQSMGLGTIQG
jgi:hypothetical protein